MGGKQSSPFHPSSGYRNRDGARRQLFSKHFAEFNSTSNWAQEPNTFRDTSLEKGGTRTQFVSSFSSQVADQNGRFSSAKTAPPSARSPSTLSPLPGNQNRKGSMPSSSSSSAFSSPYTFSSSPTSRSNQPRPSTSF